MVAVNTDKRRVETLVGLLDDLAQAHAALLEAVEAKIAAMRAADTPGITAAMAAEQAAVARIQERESLRRQLVENLARGYGISAAAARRMSAAQLAARLGGENGPAIAAAAQRLKEMTAKIAQRNHVAQLVSQNVLRHMKHVFAAMTGRRSSAAYAGDGGMVVGVGERIFDAVG